MLGAVVVQAESPSRVLRARVAEESLAGSWVYYALAYDPLAGRLAKKGEILDSFSRALDDLGPSVLSIGGSVTTTLLGVDDSKTMRKVIEITFAGEDFRTVLAENADDAMSKLHAERPSLVLVDATLEGTNGYELCQRVKSAAPAVGVILLASKQQPYDRNRGAQVGADDFIDKPFDTQQLIDKVGALLRKAAVAASVQAAPPPPTPTPPPPLPPTPASSGDLGNRARTQTLAYGSHMSPLAAAGSAPVAPTAPLPSPPAHTAAPVPAPAPPAPAPVPVAALASSSELSQKLSSMGLTPEQVAGVLALSREIVEKVVWEVVPTLAEAMIKEEIQRLTSE